eukprot:2789359-Rhodomonas_salina.3
MGQKRDLLHNGTEAPSAICMALRAGFCLKKSERAYTCIGETDRRSQAGNSQARCSILFIPIWQFWRRNFQVRNLADFPFAHSVSNDCTGYPGYPGTSCPLASALVFNFQAFRQLCRRKTRKCSKVDTDREHCTAPSLLHSDKVDELRVCGPRLNLNFQVEVERLSAWPFCFKFPHLSPGPSVPISKLVVRLTVPSTKGPDSPAVFTSQLADCTTTTTTTSTTTSTRKGQPERSFGEQTRTIMIMVRFNSFEVAQPIPNGIPVLRKPSRFRDPWVVHRVPEGKSVVSEST